MNLPKNIIDQYFPPKGQVDSDGISVIVTYRGEYRLPQLKTCIQWIQTQTLTPVEIIVVEHDAKSTFPDIKGVKHLFIEDGGLFCKSACYNYGVTEAKYDFICGIDADILVPTQFLEKGCKYLKTVEACFLANDIFYIESDMEDMFDFDYTGISWRKHRADWQFHGGTFFIRKEAYWKIGGHDEYFVGYGSEDSDFYKRVHDGLSTIDGDVAIIHVNHSREYVDKKLVTANEEYLRIVQSIPLDQRIIQLKSYNRYSNTLIPEEERAAAIAKLTNEHEQRRQEVAQMLIQQQEIRRKRRLGF